MYREVLVVLYQECLPHLMVELSWLSCFFSDSSSAS